MCLVCFNFWLDDDRIPEFRCSHVKTAAAAVVYGWWGDEWIHMCLGTPPFTVDGFKRGSVNRPWHRSRPTAAARPWIMQGGNLKKKTKKKRLPPWRKLHWKSALGETRRQMTHGFVQATLQRLCDVPLLPVIDKIFLAFFNPCFFIPHLCVKEWPLPGSRPFF